MAEEVTPKYIEELLTLFDEEKRFSDKLNTLKPTELVLTQDYFWNYVMRYSREIGHPMSREDITSRMERTLEYQKRVGCNEPIDYCRANICVNSNPNCASDKLRDSSKVLRRLIQELKQKR